MNHPLNKEQVEVLFERETVLMGTENRVPIYRALPYSDKMPSITAKNWTKDWMSEG